MLTPLQKAIVAYREKLNRPETLKEAAAFQAGWHAALATAKEWLANHN